MTPFEIYLLITFLPTGISLGWLLYWLNREEEKQISDLETRLDRLTDWRAMPGSYAITRDILSNEDKDIN